MKFGLQKAPRQKRVIANNFLQNENSIEAPQKPPPIFRGLKRFERKSKSRNVIHYTNQDGHDESSIMSRNRSIQTVNSTFHPIVENGNSSMISLPHNGINFTQNY